VRVQQPVDRVGGVEVVVQCPVHGGVPLGVGVDEVRLFGRVGAEEVVEGVPAGGVLDDEVGPGQLGEQRPHRADRETGQAGRRVRGDVGAGVQPEQPEQSRRLLAQLEVGPGEHRPRVGGRVGAGELLQSTSGLAQLAGQRGEAEPGVGGGTRGHDGQCERKPCAQGDDLVDRGGLGRGSPVTEALGQQVVRLGRRQQVQVQGMGALGEQAGQLVAARHHRQAAGCAGEQRADLFRVACVVQHDQDPPVGEKTAVQADLCVETGRDPFRRHLERVQEPVHRLGRRDR
jgi:hypothetical protein